jgi:hypothetical protein
MLCSLIADMIAREDQCGKCLWTIVSDLLRKRKNGREWCYFVLLKSIG